MYGAENNDSSQQSNNNVNARLAACVFVFRQRGSSAYLERRHTMDYGMIGKIEKAKFYAEERDERIQFRSLHVSILGDNDLTHDVKYNNGEWYCDCNYFSSHQVCSHTMAMERVLGNMVEIGVPAT
jgi:hypothetical protein